MTRDEISAVLRALRRVNLQGSVLGQTVAVRFGLSESDIETLEQLLDMGSTTAGRLSEITGLTSGAVTRVIDRLERAGFVRRVADPGDRRRVIVEVDPDKTASIRATLDRVGSTSAREIGRYTDAQLALIAEFLGRMEAIQREEASSLRTGAADPVAGDGADGAGSAEHRAPLGSLTAARLHVRSGLSALRLRPGTDARDLYHASFEGATPQVRIRDGRVLVQYRGLPFDWRRRAATIELNTAIPWTIEVVGGIGQVEADLRRVPVARLELTGGLERAQLELGVPDGEATVRLVGGVNTLRIERPRDVPIRVEALGGAAGLVVDGTSAMGGGRTVLESAGWKSAKARYQVEVVGGAKSIDVVGRP